MAQKEYISPIFLLYFGLVTGLAAIVICAALGSLFGIFIVMAMPAMLYYLLQTIRMPIIAFYGLFILNYAIYSYKRIKCYNGYRTALHLFCYSYPLYINPKVTLEKCFQLLNDGSISLGTFLFLPIVESYCH